MKILAKQSGIVAQVLVGEDDEMVSVQVTVPFLSLTSEQKENVEMAIEQELERNPQVLISGREPAILGPGEQRGAQ